MGDNGSIPTMQTGYLVTKKFTPKGKAPMTTKDLQKLVEEAEKRRNDPQKADKMKKLWNNTEKQVKSQIKSFNKTVNENKNKEWKI